MFHVNEGAAQLTLAAALRRWMPGKSWTEVRSLVAGRRVQVNGNLCLDSARRLAKGDVVKLHENPLARQPEAEQLRLRYLDEHLVVVEKPAGVTTVRHPEEKFWPEDRKQLQPTLDELLPRAIQREERTDRRGPRWPRVRPVHRLDRETSGLMVFARTVPAERSLVQQFKKHSIHRLYQAIVVGTLAKPQTFDTMLVRDRGDGRRGSAVHPGMAGKRAVTHVTPIETRAGLTLVECRLETGRTHQIRIHLAEAGFPVLGEKVYQFQPERRTMKAKGQLKETAAGDAAQSPSPSSARAPRPAANSAEAPRIMLHAAELGFVHPTHDAPLHFVMPMPADMKAVWEKTKLAARGE